MNKSKISNLAWLTCWAMLGGVLLQTPKAIAAENPELNQGNSNPASEPTLVAQALGQPTVFLDGYTEEPFGQVNSVSQLRDVAPGHWAYEALQKLIERYRCIRGYEDGTYRGNNPVTRYEFAVTLSDCIQSIERLIAARESTSPSTPRPSVTSADYSRITRLVEEFGAELAIISARVDDAEGRVDFLEDHQFSTTTKLVGEVAFVLANAFGDEVDAQANFSDKVRLTFATSFTGKDKLYTRLTAGNTTASFSTELGTNQGRFAHDTGSGDNNIVLDRLHYVFPVGDKLKVVAMAGLGAHHFYADTFNAGLEAGGGANNALSRFAERNPIYRLGIGRLTSGVGIRYKLAKKVELSAGYLAPNGSNPGDEEGLFNGNYSALGQLVFKPSSNFKFGLTYARGYNVSNGAFAFGGTGTGLGNLNGIGFTTPVTSNSYGIEAQYDVSPKFSVRAWGGYTDASFVDVDGDADIWNYALVLAFPDLGKEGNLGAIVFGAEPYLAGLDLPDAVDAVNFSNETPLHIEAFYRYQITDNISLTPGLIWLSSINQTDKSEESAVIGAIRTTFKF